MAVLINKAMIEIPPKFAGQSPVNPASREERSLIEREWKGAQGLAEDVRYYGQWMRDEAERRIGHLYPQVEITEEMVRERPDLERYKGRKLTVNCVAVGADGEKPESGVCRCEGTAGFDLYAFDEEGEGGVCRAGD